MIKYTDCTKESAKSAHQPDCEEEIQKWETWRRASENKREIKQREGWANNNSLWWKVVEGIRGAAASTAICVQVVVPSH